MTPARRRPKTVTIPRPASVPGFVTGISRHAFSILLCLLFSPPFMVAASANPDKPSKRTERTYALIYGTVWGPDARPLYGVKVEVRRADQKRPHWELYSDHRGEFALRVPPGPEDYVVWADLKGFKYGNGRALRLDQELKVHIDNDEREDIGLHLTQ